jgi:hypothetical protein
MFLRLPLVAVAATMLVLLGGFVAAQVLRERVPVRPPIVLSGSDVGFQIRSCSRAAPPACRRDNRPRSSPILLS